MELAWIPPGDYPVGGPGGRTLDGSHVEHTPMRRWRSAGFHISKDVIRLRDLDGLQLPIDDLERGAFRMNPVPVLGTYSGEVRSFSLIERDRLEENPALELTPDGARAVAAALGGRLPTWQEWEAAVRGRYGFLHPWGDQPPAGMTLSSLPWSKYWEDEASEMGMGRDSGTRRGVLTRVDDFGPLGRAASELGLVGVYRWGVEWNFAGGELPEPLIIRSLSDCGAQQADAECADDGDERSALLRSNHRAWSGCTAASYGRADRYRVGAFRVVRADVVAEAEPALDESVDEKLLSLVDGPALALRDHLGPPEKETVSHISTSGFTSIYRDWSWWSRGISAELHAARRLEDARVRSLTFHADTRRSLTSAESFAPYRRPLTETGIRIGMPAIDAPLEIGGRPAEPKWENGVLAEITIPKPWRP